MISDTVLLDQRNEIVLGKSTQCGFTEMRITGQKIRRRCVQIGEIAAPATGNPDLLRRALCLLDYTDTSTAAASNTCAHQAGRPCTEDQHIINQRRFHKRSDEHMTGAAIIRLRYSAATGMSRNLVE